MAFDVIKILPFIQNNEPVSILVLTAINNDNVSKR